MCMITTAIVGGILGAVAQRRQIEAQEEQANFYAQQNAENARLARREAEAIGIMAEQEEQALFRRAAAQKAAARTGYAAQGVVLGTGTSLDYEADVADAYSADSLNLRYDIESRKWQKRVEAVNYSDQSRMFSHQANVLASSKTPSLISGVFSTIGAAGNAAMGYSKFFA